MRTSQINYYKSILKEGEYLLLKSSDSFFKTHYIGSPLNVLTNFSGTAGEAVMDSLGKIKLLVDSRYHILAEKQVFPDVEVFKMKFGDTFIDTIKTLYPKKTVLHLPFDINLSDYLKYDSHFDLRTYKIKEKFLKNQDLNLSAEVFPVDKTVEMNDFSYKLKTLHTLNPNIKKQLVFNLDEIAYLTNLRSFSMKYSSLFRSILFLDFETKKYTLFLDKIPEFKINKLNFMLLKDFSNFIKSIEKPIHINHKDISLSDFLSIKKPVEIKKNNLNLLSSIKTASELDYIKECAHKLDKAIYNFKSKIKSGMSEHALSEAFGHELLNTGAKGLSFNTILAIGENSSSIHYTSASKDKILKDESIILLDCGGYWENGFATDITRTFYFGSNPDKIIKKVYTNVLKAFITCFLSKETNAKKLDSIARKLLKPFEADGFNFDHGLGHGIGTSVHQNPPRLSTISKDTIKPYQTHSIEPGLYGGRELKFGVRLENCVYFDLNYNRFSLTKFPFEEVLIDYDYLDKTQIDFLKNWQKEFKL